MAATRGNVVIHDYTPEALKDPAVLALAQKVTPKLDPTFESDRVRPAKVDIRTKDGKVYSQRTDYPYGHPNKPMSWEDLSRKFRDCLSHAVKPVSSRNADSVIDMLDHLEEVKDVGQIVRLLA